MDNIKDRIKALNSLQIQSNTLHNPLFYRIYKNDCLLNFKKLLNTPNIKLSDNIEGQLKELMKIKNPSKKLSDSDLKNLAYQHLDQQSIEEYGVWVYYPWSNRLVHLLDEEEFIEVRTSRNQYKITPEERDILGYKKIGIIGLSVGQSVSLTMAMERIGGELRLADFDTLELTNLNRIRTGAHNLGLPKVYAVAREIAEIDPFLKVSCFPEGLNEQNMDSFFLEGGKLDLLVEESDGFDIKILSRYKAKELKIPVIMEASDRCMVDVERFDLEPDRPILHGLVNHLDINTLKTLKTTEDKIPYMLDVIGIETCSPRLKASMLEIDQTINTWPQLASAVTMGGGISADVARRMLLNTFTESGRYYVDVEELIGNKKNKAESITITDNKTIPTSDKNFHYFKKIATTIKCPLGGISLEEQEINQLVTAGSIAPSGGNTQPWFWYYKSNTLILFSPLNDESTILGYKHYPTYVALGAAIENIKLKACTLNLTVKASLFPDHINSPELIAFFSFQKASTPFSSLNQELAKNIPLRFTNRNLSKRVPIPDSNLLALKKSIEDIDGAELSFFTHPNELENIAELLGQIEQIRLLEKVGHKDFVHEIRWTEKETLDTKDGIDLATIDLTAPERAGLKVYKNEHVVSLLRNWNLGDTFKKLTKKSIDSASAIGVVTMPFAEEKMNYLMGGQAVQRTWLSASSQGLAFQPLASSLFILARVIEGKGELLSTEGYQKLLQLIPSFKNTLGITSNKRGIFIFKISKASEPKIKSLRKPLTEIYSNLDHD